MNNVLNGLSNFSNIMDDETDFGKAILYWTQEIEGIKAGYAQMLNGTNPIYHQQKAELEKNYQRKLDRLEKLKAERIAFTQKEKIRKVELLKNECERHKKEIPKLLEKSIRQQVEQLKREFPDVFAHFANRGIPFVQEFIQNDNTSVFKVDLSKPQLSVREMKVDMERMDTTKLPVDVRKGEWIVNGVPIRIGDTVNVTIGKMKPFLAKVSTIEATVIELAVPDCVDPLRFSLDGFQMKLVMISKV